MREKLALAIEDFIVDFVHGMAGVPGRFALTCRELAHLFVDTFDGAPGGRYVFEDELADLIAPHLALLIYKRSRMFVADDEGAVERWSLELRCFIDSAVLPIMGANRVYAERNRGLVAEYLERLVAREQDRPAERTVRLLPNVAPFDSSWVT